MRVAALVLLCCGLASSSLADEPVVPTPKPFPWVARIGPVTAVDPDTAGVSAGVSYRAFGFRGKLSGLPLSLELVTFVSEDGLRTFGAGPFVGFYRDSDGDNGMRVSVGALATIEAGADDGESTITWRLAVKFSPAIGGNDG